MKPNRRLEIISCAADLFQKKGYSSTSVRDIAKSMNMEAASLYNHISSKQDILSTLLLEVASEFSEAMDGIICAPNSSLDKLYQIISSHIKIIIGSAQAVSLIPSEWVHLEGNAIQEFIALRDRYELDFKSILTKCVEEGSLKPVNIELASFSILSTLRWLSSWHIKNPTVDPTIIEEELKKCLIDGLKVNST